VTHPADLVAVPEGGGSQSGLGESFSPNLFTGTGNFTVPIALPDGRNGLRPSLDLVYSTGHGNGSFGLGWALAVPRITRKISDGIPSYDDARDAFLLSGTSEELVPIAGSIPGVMRYRPRTEGLFALIDFHRDVETSFWEVRTKDGFRSLYGVPDAGAAVTRDPNATDAVDGIFAWHISETTDPFGNRILYEYAVESAAADGHDATQTYLRAIRYIETSSPSADGFLVSVEFDYGGPEDVRPDPFSTCRAGFEIRTLRRCRGIDVTLHRDGASPARRYDFTYLDELVAGGERPAEALPANGTSLLARIRATGRAAPGAGEDQALPALEFDYTAFRPETRRFQRLLGRGLPATNLANPRLELVDLNGNGLPDFLETNGTYRYWSNLGGGRFDLPRTMPEAPAGVALGQPGVSALDIDGDGRIELMVAGPAIAGYYGLDRDGHFDRREFRRIETAPSFDSADPEVALLDLDGDGATDAVRAGSAFECFFADRDHGWHRMLRRPRGVPGSFPDIRFSDPRVRTADMTGDGLTDIVLIHDRNIEYWPNHGHGRWGARIGMRNAPALPHGYLPRQVLLGDVDGDGLADLVFFDHCSILVCFNQSGNGWSDPVEIAGTPRFTNETDVRLVDLLGVGTAGVLWSDAALGDGVADYRFLDLTGGIKPYLLRRMDNNLGAVTEVSYRSSCEDYLRDRQTPATRWLTTLPTPVQVVGSVEVTDRFSGNRLVTEYAYRHGLYDGEERSFVGFGRVTVRDAEFGPAGEGPDDGPFIGVDIRLRAPPNERSSWFELGPVGPGAGDWGEIGFDHEYWTGDPPGLPAVRAARANVIRDIGVRRHRRDALRALRGTLLREELYALDGSAASERPYSVRETIRHVRPELIPDDPEARPIFFAFDVASRTTQWDRGTDPLTTVEFSGDFDQFGQPRRQIAVGCPRGWQGFDEPRDDFLATLSVTRFAASDAGGPHIVDRSAQVDETELDSRLAGAPVRLEDLALAALDGAATVRLLGRVRNYYDGPAFEGLALGRVGAFGALVRSERLAMTGAQLAAVLDGAPQDGLPPYLDPAIPANWPDLYPAAYRDATGASAGYRVEQTADGAEFYVQTLRRSYDFHEGGPAVGLVLRSRDPKGHETRVTYDDLLLFPATISGPTGLITRIEHDYRAMQPARIEDPNGNVTRFRYTPLGLPASVARMGPEGADIGDTPQIPSVVYDYDLLAFEGSPAEARRPVSVTTVRRQFHANGPFDDPVPRDRSTRLVEYSDGFGRLLQTRTEAEPVVFGDVDFGEGAGLPGDQALAPSAAIPVAAPGRVRVSGSVRYDSKGRAVETYEPYFGTDLAYAPPSDGQMGRRTQAFFDPVGRQVRTRMPDGSETWTIPGIPAALDTPADFDPSPWESYTYDANDLAPLSLSPEDGLPLGDQAPADHAFTPASVEIDALGRSIRSVQRLGPHAQDEVVTGTEYDIRGNPLAITDALGRVAFRYRYDHLDRVLRVDSIDAGITLGFTDAAGLPIEQRDAKGARVLTAYDTLDRPVAVWARDRADLALVQREVLVYGETAPAALLSEAEARAGNLLGRLFRHYDGAGRVSVVAYDHKGNPLETAREVFSDATLLGALDAPLEAVQMDWTVADGGSLEVLAAARLGATVFRTGSLYDALDRPIRVDQPEDVEGQRRRLGLRYALSGALEAVALDGEALIRHIAYDAKGQQTFIAYGNGVMTRYAYDRRSLRLRRLRSERFTEPADLTFQPSGAPLQDFGYRYDLIGNILEISDRTPESGIPNNPDAASATAPGLALLLASGDALIRRFAYDPLSRLTSATGRDHDRPPDDPPWRDAPKTTDFTLTRPYTETYGYDVLGNIEQLSHIAGPSGGFVRTFTLQPSPVPGVAANNRLQRMSVGGTDFDYVYDAGGNLLSEEESRSFHWNFANQLKGFRVQAGTGAPSVVAIYLYGADGARVKKLVRRQGGEVQSVVTIGGFERTREGAVENDTVDVSDGATRVAAIRIGPAFPDDTTPAHKHYLTDHLGSANLVVDAAGGFVDREEFLPYGQTSFGSFARKRWRFTGQRRDEESGLRHHGARYFAPWLCRWISPDPLAPGTGLASYRYASSNPVNRTDVDGQADGPPELTQAEAARIQGERVSGSINLNDHNASEASQTPFPDSEDPNDPRNYHSFEAFERGAVGPWSDDGLRDAWLSEGLPALNESQQARARSRARSKAAVRQAEEDAEDMRLVGSLAKNALGVAFTVRAFALGFFTLGAAESIPANHEEREAAESPGAALTQFASLFIGAKNPKSNPKKNGGQRWSQRGADADVNLKGKTAKETVTNHLANEVGNKAVSDTVFENFKDFTNPVERGKAMWAATPGSLPVKIIRVLIPNIPKIIQLWSTGGTAGVRSMERLFLLLSQGAVKANVRDRNR
jgi:RHS repeat-associated protein